MLLTRSIENLLAKKTVFFAGKGGVGKTTTAAAFALLCARSGRKTLLVSTDPAHNLGDIFHTAIGGSVQPLNERLWALEIEQETETRRYLEQVKENLRNAVASTMLEEVYRQIDLAAYSPGASEAALFDRMVAILLDDSGQYDMIVFDTAPTGHTIRLLTLPELMSVWIEGLLKRRRRRNEDYSQWLGDGEPVDDPIFTILNRRRQRIVNTGKLLLDPAITGFVFVLLPEYLPIVESSKAIEQLQRFGIHVDTLVINKLLPDQVNNSPFFQGRLQQQRSYLARIDSTFPRQAKICLPLLSEDVNTLASLQAISQHLEQATDH